MKCSFLFRFILISILVFKGEILYSQVGINTENPDMSSILDVVSSDKGVLVPRVDLTSMTMDLDGEEGQANGLLVYNIGSTYAEGFYYWNGTEWRTLNNSSLVPPSISGLSCGSATLTPATYDEGVPYEGVLKIPYSGGNGAVYTGGASFTTNGLTIVLQDGQLLTGSGELLFKVSGTPTISSPESITIPINGSDANKIELPMWAGNCSVSVGGQVNADISNVAIMGNMKFIKDPVDGVKGFDIQCTTPDGLYTIRVFFVHSLQTAAATATNNTYRVDNAYTNNVQIRNNTTTNKTIMWNYITDYGASAMYGSGGALVLPPNQFGGATTGNTFVASGTGSNGAWGNPGIYNASYDGPEYRRYSWIDNSSSKVAYNVTVMAGSPNGGTTTLIEQQKVFIKIEQITAM